ncbi:peptidoglycan-binding protein [Nocardioides gansuensis]|uniref:Peptidoglycan-binding protein n=1 Tax=Nocardioides gansuensis TaxID=2138300 RepID=A0A2T8FFF4_9ACTN|nr:glycoside hydrolase domain-containing protein [Nocardioides gansuensis]PVG84425.1 peptidoglycan-binding protein [Nocardioides gansuensis]
MPRLFPASDAVRGTGVRRAVAAVATLALAGATLVGSGASAHSEGSTSEARRANVVTPGDFTGYGFDQCVAPTQAAMDKWLKQSPFLAVGIYISGDSRACRVQPNLSPEWISTQLAKGWRLLPIALGPQASCQPRFPRYKDDFKISPARANGYATAAAQGATEADKNAADAAAYGITPGSTLWYDLEGFDLGNTDCRESALVFLSAWTKRIRQHGYVAGVYSSAGSGIKMLDDARVERPGQFALPDRIWVARWDGVANTSTSYLRPDGWVPGGRVKQYQGGHNETWGGVTINIDRNFLDLGAGSVAPPESHCGGLKVSFWKYPALSAGSAPATRVEALQCLLKERGTYAGEVTGSYDEATVAAAQAWQTAHGFAPSGTFERAHWVALLAEGSAPVAKVGSMGDPVYRLQRALNAAGAGRFKAKGVFEGKTEAAVRRYQAAVGVRVSGVANPATWRKLLKGRS